MPICREHAAQAWKAFEDVEPESYKRVIRGEAFEVAAEQREAHAAAKRRKIDNSRRPGSIYYVQIADRVKIGFTTDLYQRMMHYPPHSVLLALHPGTPALERQMHQQFSVHLADGREWFHPNEELTAHMAAVNAKYPNTPTIAKMREPVQTPPAQQSTLRPRKMVRKV